MARTIKEKIKKLATPIICGAVVFASVGATAFAATSGELSVQLTEDIARAILRNTSGETRYCEVYIREYNSYYETVYEVIAYNSANVGNNATISTNAELTEPYAIGFGDVHTGATSMAPVGYSENKRIR